jgi:DNA-binding beta-propeller fold protein YncE
MTDIIGQGDYRFSPQPDWAKLPAEIELGDVAGIAIDADDRVYLFNRGNHPIVVLNQDGSFRNSWGQGLFSNAHGANIGADQCIYLTDNGEHTVRKFSLDGKLLLTIGDAGKPSAFMSGKPFCRCTHSALSPGGDIYVSDGYHNACVHKFSPDGKLIKSWGGPGTAPGEFNLPHNIACDADGWVYVADRENSRVQIFDGNGRYEAQINNMHRPSGLTITPGPCPHCIVGEMAPYLAVNRATPNIGPKVSVIDQKSNIVSRLDRGMGAGTGPGQFASPHTIALDSKGDMYVGDVVANDWNSLFPDKPKPDRLRRFQKLVRASASN